MYNLLEYLKTIFLISSLATIGIYGLIKVKRELSLLRYAFLLLMSVSCQNNTKQNEINSQEKGGTEARILLNDIWVLHKISDDAFDKTTKKHPQLEFNIAENKFYGNDGCNRILGGLDQLTNTELVFGAIAGTRMRCPEMGAVNKYLGLLKKVKHYSISNLELSLQDADKNVLLVYQKAD